MVKSKSNGQGNKSKQWLTVAAVCLVIGGECLVWNSPAVWYGGDYLAHVVALFSVGEVKDEGISKV